MLVINKEINSGFMKSTIGDGICNSFPNKPNQNEENLGKMGKLHLETLNETFAGWPLV